MRTELRHYEEWHLTVTPDEGETWPREHPYSTRGYEMQPDRISIALRRGDSSIMNPSVNVSGIRLKKDGTPGSLRVHRTYYGRTDTPAWITELVTKARSKHNLTQEALERPE